MVNKSKVGKNLLDKARKDLTAQESRLAQEKERLSKESLVARPEVGSLPSAEFVEQATEGLSEEGILEKLLMETRLALSKMKIGKYGICENCGKPIDRARLRVYPQARYDLDCETKLGLKEGA